jgi:hypothetical protein
VECAWSLRRWVDKFERKDPSGGLTRFAEEQKTIHCLLVNLVLAKLRSQKV